MKINKNKKIIISAVIFIMIVGIVLACFYFNQNVNPENGENNTSAAPRYNEFTIEATILNLSHGMVLINNKGVDGQLNGDFAQIQVDKIINHTRFDPQNEIKSNLVVGNIIWIGPFEYNSSFISEQFIITLGVGIDYQESHVKKDNLAFWGVKEYNLLE